MIRNGVIDAQREFAQRRYIAETDRSFEAVKADARRKYGVDTECCREVYRKAQGEIFALVGDILVNTYANPPVIERWEDHKARNEVCGTKGSS